MRVDEAQISPSVYDERVMSVLRSWEHTPYRDRNHAKKNGANCLGLVVKVLDELYGTEHPTAYAELNTMDSLHRRPLAVRLVRSLVRGWFGVTRVWDCRLEAGDVILVRATKRDSVHGYGHCIMVGSPQWICHAMRGSGVVFQAPHHVTREILKVYRPNRKELWL